LEVIQKKWADLTDMDRDGWENEAKKKTGKVTKKAPEKTQNAPKSVKSSTSRSQKLPDVKPKPR
jgi:hypothetical protein